MGHLRIHQDHVSAADSIPVEKLSIVDLSRCSAAAAHGSSSSTTTNNTTTSSSRGNNLHHLRSALVVAREIPAPVRELQRPLTQIQAPTHNRQPLTFKPNRNPRLRPPTRSQANSHYVFERFPHALHRLCLRGIRVLLLLAPAQRLPTRTHS
jgi:hypothetical protein